MFQFAIGDNAHHREVASNIAERVRTSSRVNSAGSVSSSGVAFPGDYSSAYGVSSSIWDPSAEREAQELKALLAAMQQQGAAQASAEKAMEFSRQEAEKNREYQAKMSSTAYQRAVEDLRQAGLNPVLAFSSGAGPASTPGGSAASGFQASQSKADVSLGNISLQLYELLADSLVNTAKTIVGALPTTGTKVVQWRLPY